MKKKFLIILWLFVLVISGCSGSSTKEVQEKVLQNYQLYLDISFESNWFFDRYNVDVLVDGNEIGTIEHGDSFTKLITLQEGDHTIKFCKESDHTVSNYDRITLNSDSTYSCEIKTHSSTIDINDAELIQSIEGSSILFDDVKLMNLKEAVLLLQEKGFINIHYKSMGSDSIWEPANWIVISTNYDTGIELDKNAEIILSCIKFNTYITNEISGMDINSAINRVKDFDYQKITIRDDDSYDDVTNKIKSLTDEEAKNWTASRATDSSSDEKAITIYAVYSEPKIEVSFSVENAKKAAITAMTNYYALDVFDDDGDYDTSKFHSYSDSDGDTNEYYMFVKNEGTWIGKAADTWHCEGLKLERKYYGTDIHISLDVLYDGNNYIISNVKDLDGTTDANTIVYESNDPTYTVSPDMISQDRTKSDAQIENENPSPTEETVSEMDINEFMKFLESVLEFDNFEIELKEKVVWVKVYEEGSGDFAYDAAHEGGEYLNAWNEYVEIFKQYTLLFKSIMNDCGLSDYNIAFALMNDLVPDNVLLVTLNGDVFADIVSGKNGN